MKALHIGLFSLMALLSVLVAAYAFALPFVIGYVPDSPIFTKFMQSPFIPYTHFFFGGLALLLGPWQFSQRIRDKYLNWHKRSGRVYAVAVFIGALTGFFMAFKAETGLMAQLGFTSLSLLWMLSIVMAVIKVKQGNIEAHRAWMIRCFALTLAAVTLRLQLPIGLGLFQFPFETAYPVISFSCWVPNIIIAQVYLMRKQK
jgi:uncharacterized membrane protein